jgi:hypothetical protein
MTDNKIFLRIEDVNKIRSVLEKFPEVQSFELTQDRGSGIGSVLSISFYTKLNDIEGTFTTELSGTEDW